MTQPTNNNQITPLTEFVDSVFTELYRWETEYSYFNMKELTDWKNTLIPLAVNLYELVQTDDAVYWWLLQLMSHVEVCKDWKEDFRKSDVFAVFSKLKREHRKIILDKCVPNHAEELQKALDDDALDNFKSMLPRIDVDDAIYKTGRVLKRAMDVHNIYERTMSHTQGDSLAILFVLFRRYYKYFANAYDNNHRSCDGIAKNIFLALYQTQYREDNNEFCEVTYNIGELWVRNLISAHLKYEGQMPQSMQKVASDILQSQNTVLFSNLSEDFNNCDTEEQEEVFLKGKGGWFELEEYSFIYNVLQVSKEIRSKTTPPFSCLCTDKKKKRKRISCNAKHCDNRDRVHYKDNYVPYIDSKNAIPLEDLETLRSQEVNKSGGSQESVVVSDCDPIPAAKVKEQCVKDKDNESHNEISPMWFPKNIAIKIDQRKRFLEILHSKLCSSKFLKKDSLIDFVFIFGGMEDDTVIYHHVDWQDGARSTLQAFCSAFYDMPNMKGKKPWSKLTMLFTLKGNPIKKLSEDANQVYRADIEERMKDLIKSAVEDLEKEI